MQKHIWSCEIPTTRTLHLDSGRKQITLVLQISGECSTRQGRGRAARLYNQARSGPRGRRIKVRRTLSSHITYYLKNVFINIRVLSQRNLLFSILPESHYAVATTLLRRHCTSVPCNTLNDQNNGKNYPQVLQCYDVYSIKMHTVA